MRSRTTLLKHLPLQLEGLWLRLLPALAGDYRWVQVNGLAVYGSSHHQRFLYRLPRGSFEPYTVELFEQTLRPGMVVLDIGAYLGYYSLLAARTVGPQGTVFAFECDPRNTRFLRHNVHLNACANVQVVQKAVADLVGVLPFHAYRGDASQSSLWHRRGKGETLAVECTTVDAVLGGRPVDVIKMDVEGGEIHALRGMANTLDHSARVTMLVECHPAALAAAGGSAEMLVGELERQYFEVQVIDERAHALRSFDDELRRGPPADDKKYFFNLLCRKRG